LLLLIASSFYSCSKSDNPEVTLSIEGTYLSSNTVDLQPIRMFTMNGEVKDDLLISRFINHKLIYSVFNWRVGAGIEVIDASITINRDKSVESRTGTNILKGRVSNYEENLLKVTGPLSENRTTQSYGETCSDRVKNINLWVFDHQVDCLDVPSSGVNVKQCKLLPGFFLIMESTGKLSIPIQTIYLSNYIKSNDQHSEYYYIGKGGWNLINPETYKSLRAGDTLVVQEKRLILEKK
ncbi:MAG: hypothetical protein MUP99_00750, partial [Pedobacter sp.]|nr:hypothetical protein [Pedobacter sp.]